MAHIDRMCNKVTVNGHSIGKAFRDKLYIPWQYDFYRQVVVEEVVAAEGMTDKQKERLKGSEIIVCYAAGKDKSWEDALKEMTALMGGTGSLEVSGCLQLNEDNYRNLMRVGEVKIKKAEAAAGNEKEQPTIDSAWRSYLLDKKE